MKMSPPIEEFPESKNEREFIGNVQTNRGNKLKLGVEYIHRQDMTWTPDGFKYIDLDHNKKEPKSDLKNNVLKSTKSREEKSYVNNSEGNRGPSAMDEVNMNANHHTSQIQQMDRVYSTDFLNSNKAGTLCQSILPIVQSELEWRKGLRRFCDFIQNKEWNKDEKLRSSQVNTLKRNAVELAEEIIQNTSQFEDYLKRSRTKLLKIHRSRDQYSILLNNGESDLTKQISENGKRSGVDGDKSSKVSKNGPKAKTKGNHSKSTNTNGKGKTRTK